jgi:hypothetical protein
MSTTTELPISDAMTAVDVMANIKELTAALNSKTATISLVVSNNNKEPVYLAIRPDGWTNDRESHSVTGKTWEHAFAAARSWIEQSKVVRRDATIRKMALAVIELTDEHTKCTDAMLKRRDFSVEQITEFHELACVRAGEMCGNAPFRVEFGA